MLDRRNNGLVLAGPFFERVFVVHGLRIQQIGPLDPFQGIGQGLRIAEVGHHHLGTPVTPFIYVLAVPDNGSDGLSLIQQV